MRTVTATQASRRFSDLIDAAERGETIRISRAGHVVAELSPVTPTTGHALRTALEGVAPLDDHFEDDIHAATALLTSPSDDPWADD